METLCPNCKGPAKPEAKEGADYINCPECGWFQVEADGTFTFTVFDPPSSKVDRPPEPEPAGQTEEPAGSAISEPEPAGQTEEPAGSAISEPEPAETNPVVTGPAPTSEGNHQPDNFEETPLPQMPSDKPGLADNEDTGIGIEISFED